MNGAPRYVRCLTFSHVHNSWMACNLGAIPWTLVTADWARSAIDRGYVVLDA